MTEKAASDTDLFNKQALMNGERVPIIFSNRVNGLIAETGGKIWMGDFLFNEKTYVPETMSLELGRTLPWLTQFQRCADGVPGCGGRDMVDKYDGHCWVDRKDVEIDLNFGRKPILEMVPGGGASWNHF